MTWCGLRGGISIALALSLLSKGEFKESPEGILLIITVTFIVVSFSILVQGLTSKKVVDKFIND